MIHLPELILDLGLILGVAAPITLIFKKLKQPVVLGYLVAGFLVSSNMPFFPSVIDPKTISIWAEIGVIFLLFALGLEFSFKKLMQVGGNASVIALVEIIFMVGAGMLTGRLLGWNFMDSLFLGAILSVSSTTIIVRAFEELGLKGRRFVNLVFGVLIVEDLFTILILVLLSTVAVTRELSGAELTFSTLRLGFFLILWFLIGVYVLPLVLKRIRPLLTDESILVVSIGLCLLMVILASKVGFSPALGAFVMGSLLAETLEGRHIEEIIMPIRDLFAAIFFVSVGMLISVDVLVEHWRLVLLISLLTVVGKFFSTGLAALFSGSSLKESVQTGLSLSQIGEFSFIIATLGVSLKVTSDFLYPVAVAVSAVTTFTTPYLIRASGPFHDWLADRLPTRWHEVLNHYHSAFTRSSGANVGTLLWRAYGLKVLLNLVLVIAIALGTRTYLLPFLATFEWPYTSLLCGAFALLASSPFLWAVIRGAPAKDLERDSRLIRLQPGFTALRMILGVLLIAFTVNQFYLGNPWNLAALGVFGFTLLFFLRFTQPVYDRFEKRFISNLNEKDRAENTAEESYRELAPWDASLAKFTVSPDSELVLKTLMQSALKERLGVSVALIERGSKKILAPGRDDIFLPGDGVFLIGNEEQLLAAAAVIESSPDPKKDDDGVYGLESYFVGPSSRYRAKSIRDCGLREDVKGMIVGIERAGSRILNPDSSLELSEGDLLWIVGDREKVRRLRQTYS